MPCVFLLDDNCLVCLSHRFVPVQTVCGLQWVEIFEGLGHHVFGALCYPESAGFGLEVLTSFVQGSQLRDAALRYVREPTHLGN